MVNPLSSRWRAGALALLAVLTLGGCAAGLGGDDYSRGQARRAMNVDFGTVQSVRVVKIEGTKSPVGAGAGAVVGGVAGSTVGGGRGSSIAAVLGAVAGGEEGVTRQTGIEVTVRLDNGQHLAVVQADGGENFRSGERVRVLRDGATTRVTR